MKEARLRSTYGLTAEDFDAIAASQDYACAICEDSEAELVVDHCHATQKCRALLCNKCNLALGFLRDDPKLALRAAEYLKLFANSR
jgi:hypothetical protein